MSSSTILDNDDKEKISPTDYFFLLYLIAIPFCLLLIYFIGIGECDVLLPATFSNLANPSFHSYEEFRRQCPSYVLHNTDYLLFFPPYALLLSFVYYIYKDKIQDRSLAYLHTISSLMLIFVLMIYVPIDELSLESVTSGRNEIANYQNRVSVFLYGTLAFTILQIIFFTWIYLEVKKSKK